MWPVIVGCALVIVGSLLQGLKSEGFQSLQPYNMSYNNGTIYAQGDIVVYKGQPWMLMQTIGAAGYSPEYPGNQNVARGAGWNRLRGGWRSVDVHYSGDIVYVPARNSVTIYRLSKAQSGGSVQSYNPATSPTVWTDITTNNGIKSVLQMFANDSAATAMTARTNASTLAAAAAKAAADAATAGRVAQPAPAPASAPAPAPAPVPMPAPTPAEPTPMAATAQAEPAPMPAQLPASLVAAGTPLYPLDYMGRSPIFENNTQIAFKVIPGPHTESNNENKELFRNPVRVGSKIQWGSTVATVTGVFVGNSNPDSRINHVIYTTLDRQVDPTVTNYTLLPEGFQDLQGYNSPAMQQSLQFTLGKNSMTRPNNSYWLM